MKTTYKILAAVAVTALGIVTSCQRQALDTPDSVGLEPSVTGVVPVTLTASYSETKVTYAEIDDGGILNLQPSWSVGDVVIGFDSSNATYSFSVTSVASDGVATLYGEAPAACTLHLIYLYGASASSISDGSLTVDYSAQAGDKTMPAVMLADGTVTGGVGSFDFKNAGAVIGFDALKGVPQGSTISRITIKGENLSGATVALDGSTKLALTATAKADDSISTRDGFAAVVSDADGTLAGKPVLIAVPAGAVISGVSVKAGSDTYSFTLSSPVTLTANKYSYVSSKTFTNEAASDSVTGLSQSSYNEGETL